MTAQKKLAPAIIGTLAAGAVVPLSAAGASAHTDAPSSGRDPNTSARLSSALPSWPGRHSQGHRIARSCFKTDVPHR
ncbi:hypothetical protein [Nesterenkonia pannonica]|uniref:hypothetical protein n=1 Tax=Nesterenkonia pannonica TaxID=1548602 RepID=UPI002164A2C0|nr:hypothetical protein [Nesterenkonia pannonica]